MAGGAAGGGYDVDCEDILDLTDSDVRSANGVTMDDLGCAWKDLSARKIEPPHRVKVIGDFGRLAVARYPFA